MNISDKETRAMFLNFKERRCLEKNVQSLDIEQAYNISLINLDQKVVKVNQKKLKDRTGRIKTNLSQDEIEEFQRLEQEGGLGVKESASKMDFKIRIAAAAKRLKLQPRAKSAVPRLGARSMLSGAVPRCVPRSARHARRESTMPHMEETVPNFPVPRSVREERRQSISINPTSVYIESGKDPSQPDKVVIHKAQDMDGKHTGEAVRTDAFLRTPRNHAEDARRRKSVDFSEPNIDRNNGFEKAITDSPKFSRQQSFANENENAKSMSLLTVPEESYMSTNLTTKDPKIRPLSVPATQVTEPSNTDPLPRPSTTATRAVHMRKKSAADISRVTRLLAAGKTSKSFSSHEISDKENNSKKEKPFRSIRESNISSVDIGSSEFKAGEELFKEMKKSMVLSEVAQSLLLEEKIDVFIEKMENCIKKDKDQLVFKHNDISVVAPVKNVAPVATSGQGKKPKQKRNVLRRRQLETRLQDESGHDNDGGEELWKDVNKCRYLRVPEEMIDLTGINTLAKDQMRMFDIMRQAEEESD